MGQLGLLFSEGQLLTQPRCDSHQMKVKDEDRVAGHPGTGHPAGFSGWQASSTLVPAPALPWRL